MKEPHLFQVNVMQDQLPGFIRTAEALQIKGLAAVNNNNNNIHAKPPDARVSEELLRKLFACIFQFV